MTGVPGTERGGTGPARAVLRRLLKLNEMARSRVEMIYLRTERAMMRN